jgi:hypothetical protein
MTCPVVNIIFYPRTLLYFADLVILLTFYSMYYSHIIRPLDSGAMLNRAAACLCFMLANRDINYNEWEGDMKSRYEDLLLK